ncbi:SGNH/GDSL hydrolase family protein [Calothrix sp. PCC 6303]|uniref:SGNH/GDSL hydrolase family protein n=1 Tax=Calothrix sp. PCC 6303 TaxID=1170562 RepID=UPI0002A00647|nr:SGNH/GDSL hydrolase family protein [Calothrix sp. PCC 6303]AFZ03718.1 lipolytic protein G-D-S-L family [Calothrix sp. PCC 6303]
MRDVYLLAAGVLTGLVVPTSTLPQLSILPSNGSELSLDVKDNSPSNGIEKAVVSPIPESTAPEFSEFRTKPSTELRKSNPETVTNQPSSGMELYYQRLAALQAGQIYTRLASDRIQALASTKKSKLTYEDWKFLLQLEARAMIDGQGVNRLSIMVGDSLSMWFPKDKLPSGKLWLNQGISGDTSAGVSKRLSVFSKTRPDVIYLMAGINDLRQGATDEAVLRNHRRIIRRLRQDHPLTQVIVQSILPTRLSTISNVRIRKINHKLALIAKQEGANYIDIHNWFVDFKGNLRQDLTTDGLHLSFDGYQVWQAVLNQIESRVTISRIKRQEKLLKRANPQFVYSEQPRI